MKRVTMALLVLLAFLGAGLGTGFAQDTSADRSATGGAQTLEDIMKRQRGEGRLRLPPQQYR